MSMNEPRTADLIASQSDHIETQLNEVENKLVNEYKSSVDENIVRGYVQDERRAFADAKVQVFVPILIERAVREKLARTD